MMDQKSYPFSIRYQGESWLGFTISYVYFLSCFTLFNFGINDLSFMVLRYDRNDFDI